MFKCIFIYLGIVLLVSGGFGQDRQRNYLLSGRTRQRPDFKTTRIRYSDISQRERALRIDRMSPMDPSGIQEKTLIQALVNDFQVNENAEGLSGYIHRQPAIAVDSAGNFVVVWEDGRDDESDIYCRRFDSEGTALESEFKVNDDNRASGQYNPSIAMDGFGNFIVVWEDDRNGKNEIYGQRFLADGTFLGSNFRINSEENYFPQFQPVVAMTDSGAFVVIWEEWQDYYYSDIYGQRYSSEGIAEGGLFKVNDDSGYPAQEPSVAVDEWGNSVVVWTEGQIYAQRYSSLGSPLGDNFKIENDSISSLQEHPSIAIDTAGSFIVVWSDDRNWSEDIYARLYDRSGKPAGGSFKVIDDSLDTQQTEPVVAADGSGNFVVAWLDKRDGGNAVYGQRLNSDGTADGNNFVITSSSGNFPAIDADRLGNFVAVWQKGIAAIDGRRFAADGSAIGEEFSVHSPLGDASRSYPSIAADDSGNIVVVWQEVLNSESNIYGRRFTDKGLFLGHNFKVNKDSSVAGQFLPCVAANGQGNFVVVWEDERNGNYDIYGQRYNPEGAAVNGNFKINTDSGDGVQAAPAVAINSSGRFIVVWQDKRDGSQYDIYGQRYLSDGNPAGDNFKVNTDSGDAYQGTPSIAIDSTGNFVVVWVDGRNGMSELYGQLYAPDGNPMGANFQINADSGYAQQTEPSVAADQQGNFVVVWVDGSDIYGQLYSNDGTASGGNFQVNETGGNDLYSPKAAMDESGNFVVVWDNYHSGYYDIFEQRFSSTGQALGQNYKVNARDGKDPVVVLKNGRIINAWKSLVSSGIFANVLDWDDPLPIRDETASAPVEMRLSQNYPNPFNSVTTITYHITKTARVKLVIYTLLGQVVATLVNKEQLPGRYTVQFDASYLASGIYFYRLTTSKYSKTRRMLLLK